MGGIVKADLSVSLEGVAAGHDQSAEHPFGPAREAAGERDVAIAGGATTINAYLAAGLLDELRLHVAPITVGDGVRIFDGVPDLALTPVSSRATPHVTHLTWRA